jgi:hypothetical protein
MTFSGTRTPCKAFGFRLLRWRQRLSAWLQSEGWVHW